MKKFIPIFSIAIAAISLQNCSNRDLEILDLNESDDIQKNQVMRKDSAKSSEEIVDPDPPVRDGDNWRITHKD
ncbi:hypothetical protein ACFOWU_06905 [Epilithonimonas zeae]|uniref:Uncharacterized protein n=1 Tax=Epilithonimonas zeae TaxID=1416779 RepID=A0A1N6FSB5_9FLAO|nr:hypothetical protein [Epilithonimonas zeae]SIN98209.1 hypothetical protein SAMN05444409_1451 [Epilithonimonas zeae]